MTASELIAGLIRTDLALSAGIVAALALRLPARRWLGARAAYGLWLLPLAATLAVLVPARVVTLPAPASAPVSAAPSATRMEIVGEASPVTTVAKTQPRIDPDLTLALLWTVGALGAVGWFARGQARFLRLARQGLGGPAAVGVIQPRIVVPADFATRYSRAERAAILAHEGAHIALQHPRANALAAALQALHWFNPLVHVAAHLMRIDQELACDAAVVGGRPRMRRLYAQTLLKSQLSATPLPLGCYWPAGGDHPLTRRVEMLRQAGAGRNLRIAGAVAVVALSVAGGLTAWAAQPAQVKVTQGHRLATASQAATPQWPPTSFRMVSDSPRMSPDGKSSLFEDGVRLDFPTIDPVTGQAVFAHDPSAVAPKAYSLTPNPDVAVRLGGQIVKVDWNGPRVILHLIDNKSGKTWAVETAGRDTLHRQGIDRSDAAGHVTVSGMGAKEDLCRPECRALAREVAFADGRKVTLNQNMAGGPRPSASKIQAALAAGEWRSAAILGATAAEIVRSLQSKGLAAGTRADQAAVVLPATGDPQVVQMQPQPSVDGKRAAPTFDIHGSGVSSAAKPGSIIVYPAGTVAFGPSTPGPKPAAQAGPAPLTARQAKLFPAAHAAAAPVPKDEKRAALAAGDWRKAAMAGATAADVVRALQARGREKGVDPDQAVVVIALDDTVEVTPLKRLPSLADAGKGGRTAELRGAGFGFSAKPGTIILYPPEANTFGATPSVGSPPGSTTPTLSSATPNAPLMVTPPILRRSGPLANPTQPTPPMAEPPILRRSGPGSETGRPVFTPITDPSTARPPPGWRPFAAVYDGHAPVLIKGEVTSVEWTWPRVLLHLVEETSGQSWAVEGGSPEALAANGFNRETLERRARVVVRGYQAKDKACRPECLANARDVTLTDGRKLSAGANPTPR
jgi:beta-lactamase regulating signal transducer with metallopeptidase domain